MVESPRNTMPTSLSSKDVGTAILFIREEFVDTTHYFGWICVYPYVAYIPLVKLDESGMMVKSLTLLLRSLRRTEVRHTLCVNT